VYSYLVKYKEQGYVNKFQVTGSVVVIRWFIVAAVQLQRNRMIIESISRT
jgi:hypothetical protein